MSDSHVRLFMGWSSYAHYQPPGEYTREIVAAVRRAGSHRSVAVHQSLDNGDAQRQAMAYWRPAAGDWELWRYQAQGLWTDAPSGLFALVYAEDDVHYWDNNHGDNYCLGRADGPLLGDGVNVLLRSASLSPEQDAARLQTSIIVRNVAYDKRVLVVYTTDGWQTTRIGHAAFSPYYVVGPHDVLRSPNFHNAEMWELSEMLPGPAAGLEVELAIRYEVAHLTYWDDNFGSNYRVTSRPSS